MAKRPPSRERQQEEQRRHSESALYDAARKVLRDERRSIEEAMHSNLTAWEIHCHLVGRRDATVRALEVLEEAYSNLYGPPGGAEPEEDDDD